MGQIKLQANDIDKLAEDPFVDSRELIHKAIIKTIRASLKPSPHLNAREWIEEHGEHSVETSSRSGKFEMFPFQAGMMELVTDPQWSKVALMKSARVGYTQLMTFLLGYFIEHDPSKSAFILPTDGDVGDFSKDSLNPMLRDISCVANLKGGISTDDKLNRFFGNGSVIYLRSAFSSDKLRRLTAGRIICDEVDADGWNSSGQGDKLKLAETRTVTVPGSMFYAGSTPLLKGSSRIESLYERGSKHNRFVPCPHCSKRGNEDLFEEAKEDWYDFAKLMIDNGVVFDGFQVLEWGDGENFGIHYKEDPENPVYICRHCHEHIPEMLKNWMDENGEWRPTNFKDDGTPNWEKGFLSLHICSLYSQFDGASWGKIVREWKDAQGDAEKMQTFWNNLLGKSFEDWSAAGRIYEPHELEQEHVIDYGADMPRWVRVLTAGVDMQSKDGGRFEVKITGFGAGMRKAVIGHYILDEYGLDDSRAWEMLTKLLSRSFTTQDNRKMFIQAAALDSGSNISGYTQSMYDFAAANVHRNWWAIKGYARKGMRGDKIWSQTVKSEGKVYKVDVDIVKDQLFKQINSEYDSPSGIVFPSVPLNESVAFNKEYFIRLTREKPLPVKGKPGKTFWSSPSDQEPWDCLVYCVAAMYGLLDKMPRRYKPLVANPLKSKPKNPNAEKEEPKADKKDPFVNKRPKPTSKRQKAKSPSWLRK